MVQLRQDNLAGSLYNLVGFQTNLKFPEQRRVLRMIPGLENAEFERYGQMHRNTFIASPKLLRPTLQHITRDDLFFAGQITGVEGYVESAAIGLLAGRFAAAQALGAEAVPPPETTAIFTVKPSRVPRSMTRDFDQPRSSFSTTRAGTSSG